MFTPIAAGHRRFVSSGGQHLAHRRDTKKREKVTSQTLTDSNLHPLDSPQWKAASVEIKDPFVENPERRVPEKVRI